MLLLFSPACPVFNFCSSTFPFVCLWCKKKGGIYLCLTAWCLSGFGGVREQFSSIASFFQQRQSVELVHRFLFITPKWIKTGMNVFWGKYLIGFKIYWREFCVCGFDPFSLECSKLFSLLIGLKMWAQILRM